MDNNLQKLTDKIYQEGVEKARTEGEQILTDVKKEAQQIIADAEAQASRIIERAEKSANEIRQNNEAEIKLAARQAISALKQKIVDLIVGEVVHEPLQAAFKDEKFLQDLLDKMIVNWLNNDEASADIKVLLPREDYRELRNYFVARGIELLKQGVQVEFEGQMTDGFEIGPQDGSYKIKFTAEDFENYFKSFMRPRSFRLLFGNEQ